MKYKKENNSKHVIYVTGMFCHKMFTFIISETTTFLVPTPWLALNTMPKIKNKLNDTRGPLPCLTSGVELFIRLVIFLRIAFG